MIDETRFKEAPVAEVNRPRPISGVSTLSRSEPSTTIDYRPVVVKRASWGAIFAGVFAAIAIQVLLGVLGAAIGLSAVSAQEASESAKGIGIGAGIWLALSSIIALFVGGWIAGRLAGIPRQVDSTLHGTATWATTVVLSGLLLTSLGGAALGGALSAMGNQNPQGSQPSSAGNQQSPLSNVQKSMQSMNQDNQRAESFVKQRLGTLSGANINPSQLREDDDLVSTIAQAVQSTGGSDAQSSMQDAQDALVDQANMNQSDAQRTLDQWRQEYSAQAASTGASSPQERQQMQQKVDDVREGAAGASWWTFFALLLGLAAASLGGYLATPRDMVSVTVAENH